MIHPTNPEAVRVKRDSPRGWHWVARFDAAIHELYDEPCVSPAPKPRGRKKATGA